MTEKLDWLKYICKYAESESDDAILLKKTNIICLSILSHFNSYDNERL